MGPLLEAFSAVALRKTVLHAATDLRITQTGVTQRIKALEGMLGATLFLRSRKGMALTREGLALQRYCTSVRDLEGELIAQIRGEGTDRVTPLTIVGPSTTMRSRVIPTLSAMLQSFPHVRLRVRISDSGEGLDDVRRGEAQFAIVPRQSVPLEMASKRLRKERYILVGPPSLRGKTAKQALALLPIVDFDHRDEMTLNFLKKHHLLAHAHEERHFINNTDGLTDLVSRGQAVSVLAEEFAQPYLERGELINLHPGFVLDYDLALVWYGRTEMPAYLAAVVDDLV